MHPSLRTFGLGFVVPVLVVLLGPGLVGIAVAHVAVRARDADGAEVSDGSDDADESATIGPEEDGPDPAPEED